MPACRSCGARVVWAKTVTGRLIPLDATDMGGWDAPTKHPDGNLRATGRSAITKHGSVMIIEHAQADLLGSPLLRSHFATCPNADQWRRR